MPLAGLIRSAAVSGALVLAGNTLALADDGLAHVTVTVLDGEGKPVPDLRQSDFVLEVDGRPQPIVSFARAADLSDASAVDVAVVVDTSGSLSSALTLEALRAVRKMPGVRQVSVFSFDRDIRVWHADAEPAALLADIVGARREGGGTALYTALVTVLEQMGQPARGAVLLLADGEDLGSIARAQDAIDAVQRSSAAVYPVTHGAPLTLTTMRGPGQNLWGGSQRHGGAAFLRRIAEISGTRVLTPDDAGVAESVQRLVAEITSQYTLGFVPPARRKGPLQRVQVRVGTSPASVRHRPAVFVGEGRRKP